ncbi:hypothetical protein KDV41_09460 [Providencia stuartii]|uniref:HeH/LEM domain-containing protein n=1 Tax=Providencia stuartii ATCC 25827 TaxID=471874 RepID=A0AA86YHF7_PROST|nr:MULTISPECIES: HeH/LEM domain-containing protein [Providencia]EDU57635.1 hypothetical protein PROSTU_04411 [Providencia stuartii ATCC 25827]MCX3070195.1 HeH/LEM domain-containing protein [Providencia stuartii]MDK7737638.1 HeH/LEM domain-containing protein [Providencia stuartii]MDT2016203.1 HeH/LEM domain-containing protein [Providencia stuartii]MDT2081187.1 HeH/LEM domain-containing protein [Providencia stuartii]
MKVIYTKEVGREDGICYRSQFLGVIHSATEVIIDGDFDDAVKAYTNAGVKVSFVKQDDLSSKTADELKDLLAEKGIEFNAKAKKADLLALLQE